MTHNHTKHIKQEKYLWIALGLTVTFTSVELLGSLFSHSLALLSDAAHLFTDATALIISITAMRLGRREADKKRTFGYYRLEILAAAFNATILFLVALFIFYEAYERFLTNAAPVHTTGMLIVAGIGVVINLTSTILLHEGSRASLNIKSAYLDAQADMLSSLGVILTALLIGLTGWQYLDSIMAIIISIWILPRAWQLLKESINILLEGVPEGIELAEINDAILQLPGVVDVHDLHVWALTNHKISLSAHLVINKNIQNEQSILQMAMQVIEEKFSISHSTIQIETIKCLEKPRLH
jgi:cobalt-zinc-cadmium efflux system protein